MVIIMSKVVSEIICTKCSKPLAEDDLGRYYAHVCKDCCEEHGLCPDCGQPVILSSGAESPACTGWHSYGPLQLEGDLYSHCPKCGSMDTKHVGSSIYECKCGHRFTPTIFTGRPLPEREAECPECGHKFIT